MPDPHEAQLFLRVVSTGEFERPEGIAFHGFTVLVSGWLSVPLRANPHLDVRFRTIQAFERPLSTNQQFLAVSLVPEHKLGEEREILIFQGGFDPRVKMDNVYENAGGLMFKYPIENASVLAKRIGSVDFKPTK